MTRLPETYQDGAAQPTAGDYFVVSADCSTWYVSTEMARFIQQELVTVPQPRWVAFVSLSGSRVLLRTHKIDCLYQSAATQRQAVRAMLRLLRQERKSDQSYDDEED
jgi:hypothetical protein